MIPYHIDQLQKSGRPMPSMNKISWEEGYNDAQADPAWNGCQMKPKSCTLLQVFSRVPLG